MPEGDETDWQDVWIGVVVGYEGFSGDPIFISTKGGGYPVFAAAPGMGEWSPQLIAPSFRHFTEILERLLVLARGRANPVEMERHPITDEASEPFAELAGSGSPDAALSIWQGFMRLPPERSSHALQRTWPSRRDGNRTLSWAGSLSLGRWTARA